MTVRGTEVGFSEVEGMGTEVATEETTLVSLLTRDIFDAQLVETAHIKRTQRRNLICIRSG
jgi:hypothetical protein